MFVCLFVCLFVEALRRGAGLFGSLAVTPATAKASAKHPLNTATTHQEKEDDDNSVTHKTPDSIHQVNNAPGETGGRQM